LGYAHFVYISFNEFFFTNSRWASVRQKPIFSDRQFLTLNEREGISFNQIPYLVLQKSERPTEAFPNGEAYKNGKASASLKHPQHFSYHFFR
jgi:hypothetical protein